MGRGERDIEREKSEGKLDETTLSSSLGELVVPLDQSKLLKSNSRYRFPCHKKEVT